MSGAHIPTPPRIPADYPNQRWYEGAERHQSLYLAKKPRTSVTMTLHVHRDAADDHAKLGIGLGGLGMVSVPLDAAELRALAARLLDAAHDLQQQHSAASLAAAQDADAAHAGELRGLPSASGVLA